MLADLPSGEVRTLNATAAPYGRPAWSPDGKWLAITDETGVLRIARVSDERFFTLSQIALNRVTPAWLDSEHVVYARQSEPQRPADLVSQRIDGSPPVPLLQNMDKVSEFAFSPDRIQLAYYRGSLGLIDFRSATDEPLGQEPSERLQWSPDSSYLLGRGGLAGVFLVHPVSPASVEQLQVLGLPAPSQGWAPDSRHFALLVDLEGGQSMLGVYDIGSRRLQHLNVQIGPPYDFAWSPR